jgi:hypothetical protein
MRYMRWHRAINFVSLCEAAAATGKQSLRATLIPRAERLLRKVKLHG